MNTPTDKPTDEKGHAMPEKSPETYAFMTYLWVIGLSAAGGAVAWYRKMKEGHIRAFNLIELIGECVTSAFAGILTFWLCELSNFNPLATASLVGIAGHMGSRAISNIEVFFEARFPRQKPHRRAGERRAEDTEED